MRLLYYHDVVLLAFIVFYAITKAFNVVPQVVECGTVVKKPCIKQQRKGDGQQSNLNKDNNKQISNLDTNVEDRQPASEQIHQSADK